ncbi:homoserine kinase [Verrucomicrobium sp. GAS474]|uniref:homoserine kinase n=1 Tax=Verrucomicrobium sp. GAS474 TaxID=1882831 RepID=UPI00087D36DA|nr:homoserine kinase [Verrucomicrobium sp. GAS474]SDU07399.1 homoserine kinase [Verrucomicrobium sp. GAS474]
MSKKTSSPSRATVRVPATSANLGPGFDTMGVALKIYNTVTVRRTEESVTASGMTAETTIAFFDQTGIDPFSFKADIAGQVPPARGLGSSVTVRLGLVAGLNALAGEPLDPEEVLALVVDLEGHPDNAVSAFHGGFATCTPDRFYRTEVGSSLKFVGLVPEFELETKKARAVLPKKVALADAIANLQYASLIAVAFAQKDYAKLDGLFQDRWHQPFRSPLIPCWEPVKAAAEKAGALGFYLSGAGSTLMALVHGSEAAAEAVAEKMEAAAKKAKVPANAFVTTADNAGCRITVA